ncbi:MAG: metallopeptidase [Oscillospiraceae bacterium]|nr:metallopeptidase [Oscillospiraceae bacterium]
MLSRNTLVVNMRFLDSAISMLEYIPYEFDSTATDGKYIFYSPEHIIRIYRKSKETVTRDILHMILHNVFRHNIVGTLLNREAWDLACDIAVEVIINELQLSILAADREKYQNDIQEKIRAGSKLMIAEKIYSYLISDVSAEKIHEWSVYFQADDHTNWYESIPAVSEALQQQGKAYSDKSSGTSSDTSSDTSSGTSSDTSSTDVSTLDQQWKDVAEKMQMDLESFSKKQGDNAGTLMQNLNAVNRERYDYTSFLKRFAVMGEAMKINDDEFDYIFYTYGMHLYERMPLIEPLEYKDVKRIKEFVIAIDTSGSVNGELVQSFVQKTYNILKQEESFFTKINLHIIQCDADIQEDVKITCQEDFDRYLETMTLKGFGGTDFRPVFRYVDGLIKNKEFTNLKGLIYFTDGYGDFPTNQPDYNTAFVFVDDEYNNPYVPVWAIKLILQKDEI